ncbi:MAG: fibronectin type III domain-containing protein, partial [Clostridia bacterium]|nr:fibronectin type III domain-containing protein [Clostridia bacterium]
MKRKLGFIVLSLALVCACFALSACMFIMGQPENKDKELDAPIDIVIEDVTENSIFIFDVIYGEEGGGATEISIDGAVWIDFDNSVGCEIGGLTPNTEYTVYARQKGYGEYPASEAFTRKVTTLRSVTTLVPANVTATIFHGTVTLNGVTDEMEISYDNGKTYSGDKTYKYDEKGEKTILVRFKETADYLAGENITLKVKYNDFAGGSGTQADPYLIENFEQFMAINTEHYAEAYKLLDDIRFPAEPVTDIIVFSGTFDGNNKKLIAPRFDYTANSDINAYGGIFHTNGLNTVIRDLTVEDVEITTYASNFVHGLLINSAKELTNCNVSGKITVVCMQDRAYSVGGLCGQISQSGSKITNCHADVTVETTGVEDVSGVNAGGLVGKISADCTIESSSAKITALINSTRFYDGYVGGLVGIV